MNQKTKNVKKKQKNRISPRFFKVQNNACFALQKNVQKLEQKIKRTGFRGFCPDFSKFKTTRVLPFENRSRIWTKIKRTAKPRDLFF